MEAEKIKAGLRIKITVFLAFSVISALMASLSAAWNPPPRTIDYRGFAYINGNLAEDGTAVSVWANDGSLKMDETTLQYGNGYFNNLKIIWDDPSTPTDEGITYDTATLEQIRFKIGNDFAGSPAYATVKSTDAGATFDVNLQLSTAPVAAEEKAAPSIAEKGAIEKCIEKWECSDWKPEECPLSGKQTRECVDVYKCGTFKKKPAEERDCRHAAAVPPEARKIPFLEAPIPIPVIVFDISIIVLVFGAVLIITLLILKILEMALSISIIARLYKLIYDSYISSAKKGAKSFKKIKHAIRKILRRR